jgi:murein DD-endopeptidase MepM/ murein hydrolase activator NlpD
MTLTDPAQTPSRAARPLRPWLATGLAASLLWAGTSTYLVLFRDEALTRILAGQMAMRTAYEARIAGLRDRIDGAAAARADAEAALTSRVETALARQAELERRQAALAGLVDVGATGSLPSGTPSLPRNALGGFAPRPVEAVPSLGRRSALEAEDGLIRLEARLGGLEEAQGAQLGRIATGAEAGLARLRAVVVRTGLDPARLMPPAPGARLGGPFVALDAAALGRQGFDGGVAAVGRLLGDGQRMRQIVGELPLRRPLSGEPVVSSTFGPRIDPFTRGFALHTGLDLKAEFGEPARATAPGVVTEAEWAGGYGNMVEIDHGHGLATRFGHLARIAVRPGQRIAAGDVIGFAGSTGRSTGTHLHYETRIDGEPVDPQRFLDAGRSLERARQDHLL